ARPRDLMAEVARIGQSEIRRPSEPSLGGLMPCAPLSEFSPMLRHAFLASCIVLSAATLAEASGLDGPVTYSTQGFIEPGGSYGVPAMVTGTPAVSFSGVTNGTYQGSAPFTIPLGQIEVKAPPVGTVTTYNGATFAIAFDAPQFHR